MPQVAKPRAGLSSDQPIVSPGSQPPLYRVLTFADTGTSPAAQPGFGTHLA